LSSSLNDKQIRFCEEYLVDYNATRAAIAAGYSQKTARAIGSENLTKPDIQGYLTRRQTEALTKAGVTKERVIEELARIALQDARQFYIDGRLIPISELSDEAAACIASFEVEQVTIKGIPIGTVSKIKRYDKVKALELLGKHLGIFEKDNEQKKQEAMPFTDSQVDKLIESLRKK
jgi:phage terminase small subunit